MYKIEIHVHTTASDGRDDPGIVIRAAARLGLKALAVTDHNTFKGSVLASRENVRDIIIIYGNEVRSSHGDILLLCPAPIPIDGWRGMNPGRLREVADDWSCITIAAHPYHLGRSSVGGLIGEPGLFDAVEVWNPRSLPIFNIPSIIYARRLGYPGTSGSDAHVIEELGAAPVLMEWIPSSVDEVLDAIRKGMVRPTYRLTGARGYIAAASWALKRRLKRFRYE